MCKSSLLFFLIVCYYDVKEKLFPYMRDGGIEVKNFGEIFKTFRESRGLRLKDVAKAGISTSQLSRFEKGETDLTISKFMLILDEINMPIDEFMYAVHDLMNLTKSCQRYAILYLIMILKD